MKKSAKKKVKKNTYGDSYRIKAKTIALIDRLDSEDIPFNTKLYRLIQELAVFKGVID